MAALDSIEIDDDARAVILTRAGERAFSAGTDIHEFATSDPRHERSAARLRPARTGHTSQLESFNKPTIAAINGLAFGDGCEITEAVHLAVASDRGGAVRQAREQPRNAADLRGNAAAAAAGGSEACAGTATNRRSLSAGAGARDRAGQRGGAARRIAAGRSSHGQTHHPAFTARGPRRHHRRDPWIEL